MTQLVFVHGVATRSGLEYEQAVKNRNELLSNILFENTNLTIHSPMWGDLVPKIEKKIFETGKVATTFKLGSAGTSVGLPAGMGNSVGGGGAAASHATSELTLANIAKTDPKMALDALFVELLETYDRQNKPIPSNELKAFASATKAMLIDLTAGDASRPRDGARARFGNADSDSKLGALLSTGINAGASYSLLSDIGQAISSVTDRIRNIASRVAVDPIVDLVRPSVGFFLGDVFAYLNDGALRETIRATIRDKLLAAHAAKATSEKFVVIGHSLGGVILTDMLCNPQSAGLPADLKIDALLTVGSQPGLFQSLGLFVEPAGTPIAMPTSVAAWFNVFDPLDPLAFRCEPVFQGVKDMCFDSITGVASAHTTYFKRPQFYARARVRLSKIGVIT